MQEVDKDYYQLLGVTEEEKKLPSDAFKKALKKRYYSLSRKYHPDAVTGSDDEKAKAEETFKEINEAYATLSDDNKRREYDLRGSRRGGFEGWGDGMRDPFEEYFGRRGPSKGRTIRTTVNVTLKEAYDGVSKKFQYRYAKACDHCHGTGEDKEKASNMDANDMKCPHCNGMGKFIKKTTFQTFIQYCPHCQGTGVLTPRCPHCGGNGMVDAMDEIDVQIPMGVVKGNYVTYTNKGCDSSDGGERGDLIVVFDVQDEYTDEDGNKFSILGDNSLLTKMRIDIFELIVGCQKEVTCLNGSKVKITVKEGSNPNGRLRLYGKGMPTLNVSLHEAKYGDLYIEYDIQMPTDKEEVAKVKEILEGRHQEKV